MTQPYNFGDNGGQQAAANAAAEAAKAKLIGDAKGTNIDALGGDQSAYVAAANAAGNPWPEVGGYAGGANAAANYYGGLASAAGRVGAPTLDNRAADAIRAQHEGTIGDQSQALGMLQASAAGGGPTAAPGQFGQGLSASIRDQQAAAGAVRGGGGGLAATQSAAMRQGAAQGQQSASQAMATRAQELQTARGDYLSGGLGMGGQALTAQGQDFAEAYAQAQLRQRQQEMNQQAALGYSGLAQGYELGQLGADSSTTAANMGQAQAAAQAAATQRDALIGGLGSAAAGGASLYADHAGGR